MHRECLAIYPLVVPLVRERVEGVHLSWGGRGVVVVVVVSTRISWRGGGCSTLRGEVEGKGLEGGG